MPSEKAVVEAAIDAAGGINSNPGSVLFILRTSQNGKARLTTLHGLFADFDV